LAPPLGVIPFEFRQKTIQSLGYRTYGFVLVILDLAVFVELRLATDKRTDTRRQHIPRTYKLQGEMHIVSAIGSARILTLPTIISQSQHGEVHTTRKL